MAELTMTMHEQGKYGTKGCWEVPKFWGDLNLNPILLLPSSVAVGKPL